MTHLPSQVHGSSLSSAARLAFIAETLGELIELARRERCDVLIYLLKMANEEALVLSVRAGDVAASSTRRNDPEDPPTERSGPAPA